MSHTRDSLQNLSLIPSPTCDQPSSLDVLAYSQPSSVQLRDGDVVVYRRAGSPFWQCRFRLANGSWHRTSTKRASLENALQTACELFDLARFRQRLGLAHKAHSFAQIAGATLVELKRQIDSARGKTAADSYVSCIERKRVVHARKQNSKIFLVGPSPSGLG
jgi:hypothetical protein